MHWLSCSFRCCHLSKVEVVESQPYLIWNSSVHHASLVQNRLDGRPYRLLRLRVLDAWWSYCIRRSLPESKIYWHRLFRFQSGECRILRGVGVDTEALCRDDSIPVCLQSVPIVRTLYFRTRIEIRKLWSVWTSFFLQPTVRIGCRISSISDFPWLRRYSKLYSQPNRVCCYPWSRFRLLQGWIFSLLFNQKFNKPRSRTYFSGRLTDLCRSQSSRACVWSLHSGCRA